MPARSQRQTFDVSGLCESRRKLINLRHGTEAAIADRETADGSRHRQILFEERWRHPQSVGHIIEPVALVVGRKHGRHIDLEREQIPNRVLVFRPIQPVHPGPARLRP